MPLSRNKKILIGSGAALLLLIYSQRNKIKKVAKEVQDIVKKALMSKADFIKVYYPFALQVQQETGVPKEVVLAQAALESAWGASAFGNNFFGIKASSTWTGETQRLKTWECGKTGNAAKDGIKDEVIEIFPPGKGICTSGYSYRVWGKFRKYATPKDGFKDHARFLLDNKRYAPAFSFVNDPKKFATAIAAAGYATDPDYKNKLHTLIDFIKTV